MAVVVKIPICGSVVFFALVMTIIAGSEYLNDEPCAVRQITGKSVICVCNTTYCDTITRQEPETGQYVAYTSSEAGSRFRKHEGKFRPTRIWDDGWPHTLFIDLSKKEQTIEGFGGAVTDAASMQWASFSSARVQDYLIESYFGKYGIEYNMLRVPIGGTDFSIRCYAYNDLPRDDGNLTNFTLAPEDFHWKIPMIRHIKEVATEDIHIVASVWAPPSWMKTNEKPTGPSFIKEQYMQTYADYIVKFIRAYRSHGIDLWAITTTNEPTDAFRPQIIFQDLGWTPEKMGHWIINNLGPTMKGSSDLKHIKILTVDDRRSTIPLLFYMMVHKNPEVLDWVDGIAVHWYLDRSSPALILEQLVKDYPDKFIINTEAAQGFRPWTNDNVALGDWARAEAYVSDILEDLNYNLVGWIEWNLCLDKQGGPNWVQGYADSPIIAYPEINEFVKQPMFYAMGHFSKWIPRGSVRLHVEEKKEPSEDSIGNVAFLTPRDTIVVVLQNRGNARRVRVQLGSEHAVVGLEKSSVTTLEFPAPSTIVKCY